MIHTISPAAASPKCANTRTRGTFVPAPGTSRRPPRVAHRISMKNPNPAVMSQVTSAAIAIDGPLSTKLTSIGY